MDFEGGFTRSRNLTLADAPVVAETAFSKIFGMRILLKYPLARRTIDVNLPDSWGAAITLLKHRSNNRKIENFMAYLGCGRRITDRTRKNSESLTFENV